MHSQLFAEILFSWSIFLYFRLIGITPNPERMELDYLFRKRPKIDFGSAKRGLCALNCECSARFSCNRNSMLRFGLVPIPCCSCAVDKTIPKIPRRLLSAFNQTDEGRKGATDTKEDPGRPRGVVTRFCTDLWAAVTGPGPAKSVLKS